MMEAIVVCKKRVYFHTNIVAPYRVHQFKLIMEVFPNAIFCLNGELDHAGENVWEDHPEDRLHLRYVRIAHQTDRTAGRGFAFFSPRLFWLLVTQRWGSVHVVGAGISGINALMLFVSSFIGHSKLVGWSDGCTKEQSEVGDGGWKRRFFNQWILRGMFVNDGWGKERELRRGVPESHIVNQNFSCDSEAYSDFMAYRAVTERLRIRTRLGIADDKVFILNVARHLEWKRLRDLAEALLWLESSAPETAKKCELVMIGGGAEDYHSDVLVKLKFVKIHMLQPMPPDEVMNYYAAADVFAFPSVGDVWGLVVNEAMSSGLPVICTEVIGAAVLVKDGWNGYKVPPKSPQCLGSRIQEIVENNNLRRNMGRNALETMRNWTSRHGVEHLAEWINRFL